MKNTISEHTFIKDMTREWYWFSYDGAKLLFDYLEDYEEQCETSIEYDPIAFRCEYNEYNMVDYINYYWLEDEFKEYIKEWELEDETIDEQYKEFFNDVIYNNDNYINWDYEVFIMTNY